jgi:hypothetical protein
MAWRFFPILPEQIGAGRHFRIGVFDAPTQRISWVNMPEPDPAQLSGKLLYVDEVRTAVQPYVKERFARNERVARALFVRVIPRESGYPVRCGLWIPSLISLDTGSSAFTDDDTELDCSDGPKKSPPSIGPTSREFSRNYHASPKTAAMTRRSIR